ncbi:hypothetical protein BCUN_1329 [Bifidobacterium cuniculi]|uniref:DUF3027 domain-containing protein n=2 Tax=Bifidobacterium cuniculi TaxID=1688 RepID=A0A087AX61_9BIFI|nr:DUF3027 domain-containing protein [Bifidobacterium cuniculi]KFI63361.1 hypothetical protein BCUN_1329 [Bifidobacterium cuniculi]
MAFNDVDPVSLARAVAIDTAGDPAKVGDFVAALEHDDGVTDFRFVADMVGYEGWQWSVTLFHDTELDQWTVDESTLAPTDDSLLPPPWVPWKDRLEPTDLSVTDSIGTASDDVRLEDGATEQVVTQVERTVAEDGSVTDPQDLQDAIDDFDLSRRHVMSPLGREQAARRWYEGPHGPKSLSTKTADGHVCSTCGFFVPLRGELSTVFGVCANRWSPDDGRVVSVDHGCGEHSEIEPPEPSRLWVQTKPAFDNLHVDIVEQGEREENAVVELLEQLDDGRVALVPEPAEQVEQTAEAEADEQPDMGDVAAAEAVVLEVSETEKHDDDGEAPEEEPVGTTEVLEEAVTLEDQGTEGDPRQD